MRHLKGFSFILIVAVVVCGFYFIRGSLPFGSLPFMAVHGRSMEPVLRQGDLILTEEVSPSQIREGDIVVFDVHPSIQKSWNYPPVVAHRVIEVNTSGGMISLRTKGDNTGEDPFTVDASRLMGKVSQQIPHLGFPIMFLQTRVGLIFLIVTLSLFFLLLYVDDLSQGMQKLQRGFLSPVIEENQRSSQLTARAMQELASAVELYAQHLQSHTGAIISLSQAAHELKNSAEEQNKVLSHLKVMRYSRTPGKVAQGRALRSSRRAPRWKGSG